MHLIMKQYLNPQLEAIRVIDTLQHFLSQAAVLSFPTPRN